MRTLRPARPYRTPAGLPAAALWTVLMFAAAPALAERFDFDSAPLHASLPLDQTVGAVTAHFSASGPGFSVEPASTMGFAPAGFGGLCLYPSGSSASDLVIAFDQTLTDFSILYAPREVACDSSAIMRLTAYKDAILVGSALATAPAPGTWPTGKLAFSSAFGFNRVVVHYERGPSSGDHGPVFMADNVNVTAGTPSAPMSGAGQPGVSVEHDAATGVTRIRIELLHAGPYTVTIHDAAGGRLRTVVSDVASAPGMRTVEWDGCDDAGFPVRGGVYFCRVQAAGSAQVSRIVIRR